MRCLAAGAAPAALTVGGVAVSTVGSRGLLALLRDVKHDEHRGVAVVTCLVSSTEVPVPNGWRDRHRPPEGSKPRACRAIPSAVTCPVPASRIPVMTAGRSRSAPAQQNPVAAPDAAHRSRQPLSTRILRIVRPDGLDEAPRTTFAHQLDTALDSRSGVDPCEWPALHTRPDPPNDPGLDPGVDVAPSPERGGHHHCRRVAEMRRRPGSTRFYF